MSDTFITSESTDSGTAVTETPAQTTGSENAASQTDNGSPDAGTPQGSSEDGQQEPGAKRNKQSVYDQIKELRSQRRELRQERAEQAERYNQLLEEIRTLREATNRPAPGTAARNPANFWQDPEAVMEAKLQALKDELRESIVGEFHTVRQNDAAQTALHQERGQAVEFIRTQKGYSPQDDEELIEIIQENGLQSLQPMQAARAAWSMLQQQRGVSDRTILKQRATGVVGQPPGAGFGRKNWSQAEFDAAVNMLEKNPHDPKNTELMNELMLAHREGRVK